jgi:hypothetical protein
VTRQSIRTESSRLSKAVRTELKTAMIRARNKILVMMDRRADLRLSWTPASGVASLGSSSGLPMVSGSRRGRIPSSRRRSSGRSPKVL